MSSLSIPSAEVWLCKFLLNLSLILLVAEAAHSQTSTYQVNPLPLLTGSTGVQIGSINNRGLISTYATASHGPVPYIGSPSSGSALAPLPPGTFVVYTSGEIAGIAINNAEPVAGTGLISITGNNQAGYYYSSSALKPIPPPPPPGWQQSSIGVAISKAGVILCFGQDQNNVWHAFIFDISTGNHTIIAVPAGWNLLQPVAINSSNQVVGFVNNPPNLQTNAGFVWDSTHGTRLLNDLVPAGWTISTASGINDSGQIAAIATNSTTGFSGPVRLDPTNVSPPDSSFTFYYDAMGNLVAVVPAGQLPAPQFLPPAGTYTCPFKVQITDPVGAAAISYTTGSGSPTTSYAAPIMIASGTTIKALAVDANFNPSQSAIATVSYVCATSNRVNPPTNLNVIVP